MNMNEGFIRINPSFQGFICINPSFQAFIQINPSFEGVTEITQFNLACSSREIEIPTIKSSANVFHYKTISRKITKLIHEPF